MMSSHTPKMIDEFVKQSMSKSPEEPLTDDEILEAVRLIGEQSKRSKNDE